jgi:hypothetical protein
MRYLHLLYVQYCTCTFENCTYLQNEKILLTYLTCFLYRIAYSVYEVERLLDKYRETNVAVKVTYDIACTLEAHLKVLWNCDSASRTKIGNSEICFQSVLSNTVL